MEISWMLEKIRSKLLELRQAYSRPEEDPVALARCFYETRESVDYSVHKAAMQIFRDLQPSDVIYVFLEMLRVFAADLPAYNAEWLAKVDLIAEYARVEDPAQYRLLPDIYLDELTHDPVLGEMVLFEAVDEIWGLMLVFTSHWSLALSQADKTPCLTISKDILLTILYGWAESVVAGQPPEHLHFPPMDRETFLTYRTSQNERMPSDHFLRTEEEIQAVAEKFELFVKIYTEVLKKLAQRGITVEATREEAEKCIRNRFGVSSSLESQIEHLREVGKDVFADIDEFYNNITREQSDFIKDERYSSWGWLIESLKWWLGYPIYYVPGPDDDSLSWEFQCLLHHDIVDSEGEAYIPSLEPHNRELEIIAEKLQSRQNWIQIRLSKIGPFYTYRENCILCSSDGRRDTYWSPYGSLPHFPMEEYTIRSYFGENRKGFLLEEALLQQPVPNRQLQSADGQDATVYQCLFGSPPPFLKRGR